MPVALVANNYGKSRIRMVQVARGAERHTLKDISVDIRFEGDFESAHTRGDNSKVLPTDTMKNTVYALAAEHPVTEIEEFGLRLSEHFLGRNSQVSRVRIAISEKLWSPIPANGNPHPSAFIHAAPEKRTATITAAREDAEIQAGIDGLLVMKTAGSAFDGYLRDQYTTLKETRDRLLATIICANWIYDRRDLAFGGCWEQVRSLILSTFAGHKSESVQHTLYAMAEAVLNARPEICEIHLSLPNQHHLPVDLTPFGLKNKNEIFVPTDEPHGLIQATLKRT